MQPTHSQACNHFMTLLKTILEDSLLLVNLLSHNYSDLLTPIIFGKPPKEIQKSLARRHNNTEWTLDELRASIMKEIQILETEVHSTRYHDKPTHSDVPPITTGSFYTDTRRHSQQSPNTGHMSQFKGPKTCFYRKQQHSPCSCDVISTLQDCLAIVKKNNLCFNCLAHHKFSQCNSKYKCKVHKQKHHTSPCTNSVPSTLLGVKSESMIEK